MQCKWPVETLERPSGRVHCCDVRTRHRSPRPFHILFTDRLIMDNTTSSTNAPTAAPVTPFPASNAANGGTKPAPVNAGADTGSNAADAAAPIVDRLLKRATSSAHDAVDSVAAKVSSIADGLQGGVSKVGDTRDEWIESARDVIREHPFAAVAGALVIGAALLSLNSSRRD